MPSNTFLHLPETKRESIIEAARNAFSEKIFEKVKVVHICTEAGIPRATFYNYFSSLADLYSYLFFYADSEINLEDMDLFFTDGPFDLWEQYLVKLVESDQGQRVIFDDLQKCPPVERILYHLMLSLIKQYSLNLLTKRDLFKQYEELSRHISEEA